LFAQEVEKVDNIVVDQIDKIGGIDLENIKSIGGIDVDLIRRPGVDNPVDYDDNESNVPVYGRLYSWGAVMRGAGFRCAVLKIRVK